MQSRYRNGIEQDGKGYLTDNFTVNGNSRGAPCVFPFLYRGHNYSDCTDLNYHSKWCSTTDNYDGDRQWGECLSYDVCKSHKTLSDPWRNVAFYTTSFPNWTMNDNNLQDGWYKFTGIGGDRIVYYCPHISLSSPSNELLNSSRSFQSSSAFHLYTCDINTPQLLHCGGALVLYYLTKNKGMYITCHSSCSASSCGEYAQCNPVDGSCVCNSGFSIPEGFLPTGDSYGCTGAEYDTQEDYITTDLGTVFTTRREINITTVVAEGKGSKDINTFATTEENSLTVTVKDRELTLESGGTNFTAECAEEFLENIQNMTVQELPHKTVEKYLAYMVENCTNLLENTDTGQNVLISYGNAILKATEKLVSTLVKHTETYYVSNITFQTLEAEVFVVGPKASLSEITLNTSNAYMDIDLIGISKNNNGSAAVAFINYSNMLSFLKPSFFNTTNNTVKTMMSTVVSVTLPKTNNTHLTEPVNFTLKHIVELDPEGFLSCVYWKETEWVVDGCIIIQSNSNQTVCSCIHLSTFALIMQTNPGKVQRDELDLLELLNKVAMSVGLVFLSLALLTFALCPRSQTVTNIALINLCTSLLLAHIIFLLIQHFLHTIKLYQEIITLLLKLGYLMNLSVCVQLVCTALAGVLHFFFLSAFVWMFLDAVLLFIAMRNLSRIRSKQEEVLNWKCLIIIGYVIPLVIVGVSAGLFLDGYGSEQCWLKKDGEFLWSFLGPVCFVLTSNGIIFIIIVASFTYTLKHRDSEILQMNQNRATKKLIKSVTLKIMAQSVILGCPWILGFFTRGNEVVEILFLVLNSQQGTFIFLVHCVFNQEVSHHLLCIRVNHTFTFTPNAYIGAITAVTGYTGQSVQIRCPYESGYETHTKYLCRGPCSILSLTSKDIPVQSGSVNKDERFSLNDDTAARVFTVTITDLRSEDGGTYWCAIQRTLRDIYTEVELLVEMRFITVLSVCIPLLFSGLALGSVVLYCKMRKTTFTMADAFVLTRTQKGTSTHKDGNLYESDLPGMGHVYQNLKFDTNQSDSVYQSLQFETNEYDSIYQTLTPQTSQSDTIYKVQNPTPIKSNCAQSTIV
ncbi:hypothetical protein P4O66_021652 [Electrophorus voltai]|uniref:Uncharacterized protein n=1 Tax=Electrophorus voltai TaxID=2609070 RepID=A0AAD8ZPI8_9TELE|nr:hypothetical protein P4O66_021652 [Electrophorus voltai]